MIRPLSMYLLALAALATLASCRCVTCDDDDGGNGGQVAGEMPWTEAGLQLTSQITGVFATDAELFVFSPTEFVRVTPDSPAVSIIEKRQFPQQLRTLGQVAPHPLAFARAASETTTARQVLEFQLVQNAAGIIRFNVDSLTPQPIALETQGETVGAFDREGRTYVQPVIRRDTRSLALLFFTLDYTTRFDAFTEVAFRGLVDVPGVLEDDAIVQSIQFIDGFFYLATKRGGYRVTGGGIVTEVIPSDNFVKDFFEYDSDYYASVNGLAEVQRSFDGEEFERSGFPQRLGYVQVFGDRIISQEFAGWMYHTTESLSDTPDSLLLNQDFPVNNSLYFGLDRLDGTYYLGVDRVLYRAADIEAVE